MPPSGFIKKETTALASFMRSLYSRFEKEVQTGVHPSIEEGIQSELKTIEQALLDESNSPIQKGVLQLCKSFYEHLESGSSVESIIQSMQALLDRDFKQSSESSSLAQTF